MGPPDPKPTSPGHATPYTGGPQGEVDCDSAVTGSIPEHDLPTLATPTGTPSTQSGPPHSFSPEDVVAGRYRIVRFVAKGGMGEVYEAQDFELGERVALKTLRPEIAAQPGVVERFKREIQLARKVSHSSVCRTFDFGHHRAVRGAVAKDVLFLTMEYLEGETLSQRLKAGGRLSPADALPLVRQMAAALQAAHDAGIVHRDFKSSNVLLVSAKGGPRVVVTDFGLARAPTEGADSSNGSLTGSGVVGTPYYMAPEQVTGGKIGPRTDLYSLGIVLYEMVTGRLPFDGDSPLSIAVKRLTEKPTPPRQAVADLDPRWEAAVLRCLEVDPADRFAAAGDVVRSLEGESVTRGRRTRRRLVAATVAGLAVVGLGGLWVARVTRGPSLPPGIGATRMRRSVAVLGFKNLGQPEAAWLSTALSEMLRTELAAGGQLRTIPGESVARVKRELSLAETDSFAEDTLARIRSGLGADLVLVGSYLALGKEGQERIRLDLRLQDAGAGEVVAAASETGTATEVFDLVSRAGEKLRVSLGVDRVSETEASAVRATFPGSPGAGRLYAEGLARLRVLDALTARRLLEEASAVEPSHPLIHSALAQAWTMLGYDEKARAESKRALALSQELSREDRLSIQALDHEAGSEWGGAARIWQSLLVFFPDSLEYGLRLAHAQTSAGNGVGALTTVEGLRRLPSPASGDPRIDLAEAAAAKSLSDFERQRKAASVAAQKAGAQGARLLRAQARLVEGTALVDMGRLDEGQAACEEAERIFADTGEVGGVARSEHIIAVALGQKGDLSGARTRFLKALESFRQSGDRRGIAHQLGNLGTALAAAGDRKGARKLYLEALEVWREISDHSGTAKILNNLGSLLEEDGDLAGARKAFEEALRLLQQIGERRYEALVEANLGEVLHRQGRLDDAQEGYERSLRISLGLPDESGVAATSVLLGKLLIDRGDLAGAQQSCERAVTAYRGVKDRAGEAEALRLLADVRGRRGDAGEAKALREQAARVDIEGGAEP
jgi:tetratricopeptide (TPR) repeat protein